MSRTNRPSLRPTLRRSDVESCRAAHAALLAGHEAEPDEDCGEDDCDCFHDTIVMVSLGYVMVYQTGEVVADGRVLHTFDSDSSDEGAA